jgi:hypothetical protein
MVFAGISGTVTTTYGMNLDNQKLGFTNGNDVEADFSFTTEGEAISEGDIHAEITAELTIDIADLAQADTYNITFDSDSYDLSAKIVGPNWYVDIAGPDDLTDYAEDIDADDDDTAFHDWGFAELGLEGITVGYTYEEGKTVVVALGSDVDVDDTNATDYLAIASPEYMLAEGLTVEGAVAVQNVNKTFDFGVGMTMTLADEEMGYSVVAATDMGYDGSDEKFDIEASMEGTYSLATIEAYFATTADYDTDADYDDAEDYSFDLASGTNLVSAILTLDLEEVIENTPVTVYAQIVGMDVDYMYDTDNEVNVAAGGPDANYRMNFGADYTFMMDEASLAVGIDGGIMFDITDAWKIGADAEYTAASDAYVADLGVTYFNLTKEVTPTASIETTTLVNGATLTLDYSGARIALDDTLASGKAGMITATCEIEL